MANDDIKAPILLKTKLPESGEETVQLERHVPTGGAGGATVRRRATMPVIGDEDDPELACKVFKEFQDLITQNRFHLNTGALRFEFWRQVLRGQARDNWDAVLTAHGAGRTANDFLTCMNGWFANYMDPTAFSDQKEYFLTATKAYSMTVKQTAARITQIIGYMRYFPGCPGGIAGNRALYTDGEKKSVLYRLMLPSWKTNFDASGNDITDGGYTYDALTRYFTAQEKRTNSNAGRGGRGRGGRGMVGGRGFGRGSGGRGRLGRGGIGCVLVWPT